MTRKRKLSEEDSILWHRVRKTVTPLQGRTAMARPPAEDPAAEFVAALNGPGPEKKRSPRPTDIRSPLPARTPPPGPAQKADPHIDRPTTRKIAKGRISIDARIDLHAMTQDQAHDRLYTFLADQRSRGARHVLVVTGKGRSLGSEGVLKRMVPIWLNSPRFAGLVSGYSAASRQHGGEGAMYLRLRKLARSDGSMKGEM